MQFFYSVTALLLGLCLTQSSNAQPTPMKWGKVSDAELTMSSYTPDTSVSAVVLGDFGVTKYVYRSKLELELKRHRRIKILSEQAFDEWGTHSVSFYAHDRTQRVEKLEAQIIYLGDDGARKTLKLDKNSFFDEDLNGFWRSLRFTFPQLKPGAIIEYRYTLRSDDPTLVDNWYFQTDIPTLHSEYRVEYPNFVNYTFYAKGAFPLQNAETIQTESALGPATLKKWIAQNVPALKEESFMRSINDYRTQIEFQITSIRHPETGAPLAIFSSSWNDLSKTLWGIPEFGKRLEDKSLSNQAKTLSENFDDPTAQVKAIYDFVQQNVSWDNRYSILAKNNPKDVLSSAQGSSGEMTLLLISMLRSAGFTANPVLISTRENGAMQSTYISLKQFNSVLAHVQLGDQSIFLNPIDKYVPFNMLSVQDLNDTGLLVRDGYGEWVEISPGTHKYLSQVSVQAELNEEGSLEGNLQITDSGYSALSRRKQLSNQNDTEFITSIVDNTAQVELKNYTIENKTNLDANLISKAAFTIPSYAQSVNDLIYLKPYLFEHITENPFRLTERTFPVDFAYPTDKIHTFTIKIPQGYEIIEAPEGVRMKLSSGGGLIQRLVQVQDDTITIQARLKLGSLFSPEQYLELRAFYDQIITIQGEQVVLKKVVNAGN